MGCRIQDAVASLLAPRLLRPSRISPLPAKQTVRKLGMLWAKHPGRYPEKLHEKATARRRKPSMTSTEESPSVYS